MSGTDEQTLSRRLHEQLHGELDALPAPAAPVAAVIRRGAARRAQRWVTAASGLAAVAAVAVSIPLLSSRSQPAGRPGPSLRAGHVSHAGAATPIRTLTGTTFAAGTAAGRPWQLSVRNIADPGARCLPAIMLNATDGYLPPLGGRAAGSNPSDGYLPSAGGRAAGSNPSDGYLPSAGGRAAGSNATGGQLPPAGAGVPGGLASLAFLTSVPGQPGAGFAALRVAPDVTRLTVVLRSGGALAVRPVTVRVCGQRLPLAGFSYPRSGVATITAYAGPQVLTRVTPPASLFTGTASPADGSVLPGTPGSAGHTLRLVPGVWQQLWRTPSPVASGAVAVGRLAGTRWRISVQLGAAGDCFTAVTSGGQAATQATDCVPIAVPPRTVRLRRLVIRQRTGLGGTGRTGTGLAGYAGLASPRAAYLVARLSDGSSVRVRPVQIGGRQYVALAVPAGRTVTRVTVYDRAGLAFGIVKFTTVGR